MLNSGTFIVGHKKLVFKLAANLLMVRRGANFLPINQYMALYESDFKLADDLDVSRESARSRGASSKPVESRSRDKSKSASGLLNTSKTSAGQTSVSFSSKSVTKKAAFPAAKASSISSAVLSGANKPTSGGSPDLIQ